MKVNPARRRRGMCSYARATSNDSETKARRRANQCPRKSKPSRRMTASGRTQSFADACFRPGYDIEYPRQRYSIKAGRTYREARLRVCTMSRRIRYFVSIMTVLALSSLK
jgi:hypothetical protein